MIQKLTNLFKKQVSEDTPDYSAAIHFAINKYIEGHEVDDEEFVYNAIRDYVGEGKLADQIYVFLPVALTREWLKHQPINLSDTYLKVNGKTKGKEIKLNSIAVYRQIVAVLQERLFTMPNEDALKILVNSAEMKAISQALTDGSKLEDLLMTPPATWV
eukprot:TRINITY_DN2914_c0_g1_i3.p2 TRINITY_DN2914_c0_g1~~TRINITY_DN2914_c0_g1_i3.p2  ORF type:complete len:159 (-),score=2.66 TRINITY_DN2914_c0_g1_i3:912-1388(-)